MEKLITACGEMFNQSTQPFGIVSLCKDDADASVGFCYEYLNPALASITGKTVDELLGKNAFELWPTGDAMWIDYFSRAAFDGEACEFDAVSPALSEFLHVSVFPVKHAVCGFSLQCVTQWVSQAQTSLKNVKAGIFFYDMRTHLVMLTEPACELTGVETGYFSFVDFMHQMFGEAVEKRANEDMAAFRGRRMSSLLFTERTPDGRWLRVSLGHVGDTDQFAFGVIEDITRLHEAEEKSKNRTILLQQQKKALETALDLAEQGSRAKSAFLANMSHDFRTPMNAITGFADIALDNLDDAACVEDCLRKIQLSSGHLLDLVNEILDVSRIESGKLSITCKPLTLSAFIEECASVFASQAEARGLDFAVEVGRIRHDEVLADRMRLSQILMNVLGNAFKFTPDEGRVTLKVFERDRAPKGYGTFVFKVKDTGCGMSPEFIKRVFEPFERFNTEFVRRTEGTGLGMTITKSLVDLMGGSIDVSSKEGQGSTFTISLPLELDGAPAPSASDADEAAGVAGEAHGGSQSSALHAEAMLAATPEVYDFSGRRALIADDDDLSREVLSRTLARYGFAVDEARDGKDAVAHVTHEGPGHYDVIMLDMRMPRMNGDEAARAIRQLEGEDADETPILAVTADAFDEVLRTAEEAGMAGRVTKPLDVRTLMSTLKEHLS